MTRLACPVCSDALPCTCPPDASLDCRALRTSFGRFATGITVVTAEASPGKLIGMTVNSFSSVSLDPPLVLWCLGNDARNFEHFFKVSHYCINILSADQRDLSDRFASRSEDRFAGVDWQAGVGGAPVLAGCCASFEVRNETRYGAGDHHIFVGRVERFSLEENSSPLIFHAGCYATLSVD